MKILVLAAMAALVTLSMTTVTLAQIVGPMDSAYVTSHDEDARFGTLAWWHQFDSGSTTD